MGFNTDNEEMITQSSTNNGGYSRGAGNPSRLPSASPEPAQPMYGKVSYNGHDYPWFYGSSSSGLKIEVDISTPCRVMLLYEENFIKYLTGQKYAYFGGDHEPKTVVLKVQNTGRFYLVVQSIDGESKKYAYRHYHGSSVAVLASGKMSYDERTYPWFHGSATGLLTVEIDISAPSTVFLINEENFLKYLSGQRYTYSGGDYAQGTVTIKVRGAERFYLEVLSDSNSTYSYRHYR